MFDNYFECKTNLKESILIRSDGCDGIAAGAALPLYSRKLFPDYFGSELIALLRVEAAARCCNQR